MVVAQLQKAYTVLSLTSFPSRVCHLHSNSGWGDTRYVFGALLLCFNSEFTLLQGMLLMDELRLKENQSEEHHVSVRPSQTKIRYPVGMPHDPAMLTIDLLRISRLTTPSSISADIIINLAENGVPPIEFVNLFKSFVREIFHGLTTWEGPNAMYNLWVNVERAENVLAARRTREAAGEARARGYTNRSPEDAEPDHNDNDDDNDSSDNSGGNSVPKSVSWWPDHISGCPSSLAETVMVLLDSGFRPQECPMLRDKLKRLLSTKIESKLQKIRFEVAQSCLAFAVPGMCTCFCHICLVS